MFFSCHSLAIPLLFSCYSVAMFILAFGRVHRKFPPVLATEFFSIPLLYSLLLLIWAFGAVMKLFPPFLATQCFNDSVADEIRVKQVH